MDLLECIPSTERAAIHACDSAVDVPHLTFRALHACVRDAGESIAAFGVEPTDLVCLVVRNGPLALTATLALSAYCRCAPVSPSLTSREYAHELSDGGARWIAVAAAAEEALTTEDHPAVAEANKHGVGILWLVPDASAAGAFTVRSSGGPTAASAATNTNMKSTPRGGDDIALVVRTSGTTGTSKIVPLSHANLIAGSSSVVATLHLSTDDRVLNVLPLHHMHGLAVNAIAALTAGCAVVCAAAVPRGRRFVELLRRFRITWFSAVPTVHLHLLAYLEEEISSGTGSGAGDHGDGDGDRIGDEDDAPRPCPSLRFVRNCSAALYPSVAMRLERALGVPVVATYAMSECLPICSNPLTRGLLRGPPLRVSRLDCPRSASEGDDDVLPTPKHKRKLDSVGPAAAGVEVRIWSREEERWLAAATALPHEVSAPVVEGEVCVRGDCAILQYDDTLPAHVDANRNAWLIDPDGGLSWLRTGDKGWLDEDAHLHLTGRFKEMINRAGESVPPALVEAAVLEHPAIASCVAFAVEHDTLGEVVGIAAVPVLKSGVAFAEEITVVVAEVRTFCIRRRAIQAVWLPEVLVWVADLPTGATGKVQRIDLARLLGVPPICRSERRNRTWVWNGEVLSAVQVALPKARVLREPAKDAMWSSTSTNNLAVVRSEVARVLLVDNLADNALLLARGLDSISAVLLVGRLEARFGVPPETAMLTRCATIVDLAEHIEEHGTRAKMLAHTAVRESADAASGGGLWSARCGDVDAVRAHVAKGWCPHSARDAHGINALQWAAGENHVDMCCYLVEELGVFVDAASREGRTPLMWSCRNGHFEAADALVAQLGASVQILTKKGVSALHWATWGGDTRIVALLLARGCDIDQRSKAGCSAAVWACSVPAGSDAASVERCLAMVSYLHAHGADFGDASTWGNCCLAKAAFKNNAPLVIYLLDTLRRKEDLFRVNSIGECPLDIAEQSAGEDMCALLRQRMRRAQACRS